MDTPHTGKQIPEEKLTRFLAAYLEKQLQRD